MNREIKFRAWEPDAKEMIYFDNLKASKDPYIASHLCALMANDHPKGSGLLMQYTNIKDAKGTEIYEGDIVRCRNEDDGIYNLGSMEDFYSQIVITSSGAFVPYSITSDDMFCEVEGNIYENPELLEE